MTKKKKKTCALKLGDSFGITGLIFDLWNQKKGGGG